MQVVWSSALTFIPCELSERVSHAFNGINDMIWTVDWYKFPIEMKKMIPIILIESQSPVSLKCFGSIACDRELFKRVRITIGVHVTLLFPLKYSIDAKYILRKKNNILHLL